MSAVEARSLSVAQEPRLRGGFELLLESVIDATRKTISSPFFPNLHTLVSLLQDC